MTYERLVDFRRLLRIKMLFVKLIEDDNNKGWSEDDVGEY